MKIKQLEIDGFRCLCNLKITFEDSITLIVGENDSGKSSIISCLNLFTEDYALELDDFNYGCEELKVKLVTEDFEFIKEYRKEKFPESSFIIIPSQNFILKTKEFLTSTSESLTETQEFKIKDLSKKFGLTVRANSNVQTLKNQLNSKLSEDEIIINNGHFFELNKIQLDGKQFEDVESFFKEVFLKDKQANIWDTKIPDGKTIKEIIQEELDNYSKSISEDLKSKGIKEKLKQYLNQLTDIKIEPLFEPKNLNIYSKVKFLEDGNEISVEKKGDGTKRRISLALLEYKVECEESCKDSKLYILDEPDTHLHVKAQLELLNILKELGKKGCQIIITTHSPFLINAIKPKQIRLLVQENVNETKIKSLKNEPETSDEILRKLGIENIYLYFAKKIILVEGETEESFLPRIYEKIYDVSLNSDLIKVINTRGIKNIPGFAKALLELVDENSIYVVKDNDASEETLKLIDELNIHSDRQINVGTKEFEDSFSDNVLYESWKNYLAECGKDISESKWTLKNISKLRAKCNSNPDKKFSSELKSLNQGSGKKFSKIIFGEVLGNYCDKTNIPDKINEFLSKLSN
ncbi:AAA family ATPase [Methanosarcina sp. DH1]|uniref:ATP-dependent nuclease n=1 Tax=Methanosarcina sp. DH1 TaxID=2605695 RepID=UPI001E3662FB|nr:AAA family ATPase [Methanosarcina sp. DH1]MCC4766196.1 AAA family ATPase [Methanosarcina sp. DH1]